MSFDFTTLITDRTQADVDRVLALAAKGWDNMTEAERMEWSTSLKAAYNASALNRVTEAVDYLVSALEGYGYAVPGYTPQSIIWTEYDTPTASQMAQYLANVEAIRSVLAVLPTTPNTPESMAALTWAKANDIEQILCDIDTLLTATQQAFIRANVGWVVSGGRNYCFCEGISGLYDSDGVRLVSSDDCYLTSGYSYQYRPVVVIWAQFLTADSFNLISSDNMILEGKIIV